MTTAIRFLLIFAVATALTGCASTLEDAHQGIRTVAQPAGSAARVPNSVMEGAAEGVTGQPKSNPYNR